MASHAPIPLATFNRWLLRALPGQHPPLPPRPSPPPPLPPLSPLSPPPLLPLPPPPSPPLFLPPSVGKTSLLKTLPPETTLCVDLEAGMKSVQDWPGDSIPIRAWLDAVDIACLIGGSTRRRMRAPSSPRATTSTSPRPTRTWSG